MATMYVERCRRRPSSRDVIETWFMLSRSAYQRILDVALADMTSAEVLQHACASSSRGSELLRLLSDSDDVSTEQTLKPSDDVTACVDRRMSSGGTSGAHGSPEVGRDGDVDNTSTQPLPLVVSQRLAAGDCRRRLDWSRRKDGTRRKWPAVPHDITSSQPLCLRVPGCRRSRSPVVAESDQQTDVVDDTTQSLSLRHSHVDQHSERRDDDVTMTSLTEERHLVDASETNLSVDLTRKRRSLRQPEVEVVRVDGNDGDGWAPINKDVLVSIVERLSVSCLQPPPELSSSEQTSRCEFKQPMTPLRRADTSGKTGEEARDVTKRAAITPQPVLSSLSSSSRGGSADAVPPAHKTRRLSSSSPSVTVYSAGRRKSSLQRRVQVRHTWNVPADKALCRANRKSTASAGARQLVTSRHVWAPLEKSVVLSVIDHILVDGDGDRSDTSRLRRCEQPSRRRWLQPPSLRDIAATSPTDTRRSDDPATTADEASFKWKSNILRRMRKEQTGGRWLDAVPGAVAATGS